MKNYLLTSIGFLILMVSCKLEESKKTEIQKQIPTSELKTETIEFDQNLIQQLYNNLKSDFELDFQQKHLNLVLNQVKISELKKGTEFEKKMLFEDFECECYDKIKISFSGNRFILWVYEEFYEEGLDWCPESSYSYSFLIENDKITDLKLDFMAG